jgi:hypothetical protein
MRDRHTVQNQRRLVDAGFLHEPPVWHGLILHAGACRNASDRF